MTSMNTNFNTQPVFSTGNRPGFIHLSHKPPVYMREVTKNQIVLKNMLSIVLKKDIYDEESLPGKTMFLNNKSTQRVLQH